MAHPPADRLLSQLASGQREAYAAVYDRLAPSLLRAARVMLGRTGARADAEDAVQEVFVELVRNCHRLVEVRDLDAYIFSMLRHAADRRIQRHRTEQRYLRQMPLAEPVPVRVEPGSAGDIESALLSLPPAQCEVIALKVDAGLTFAQVAEILGVSVNTAASRYRYALEKLRRELE